MLRRFVILLPALTALVAQTPPTGSIAGVVRDAATEAPLAGVHVSLAAAEAVTDPLGRFRFDAVAPGARRLWASGEGRPGSGVSVLVRAGEEATAEIRLKLGAAIAGRVLDPAGNPVANAVVMLLERRYRYGELVYSPDQTTLTNAAGEYRLTGIAPDRTLRLLAKKVLHAASVDELPAYDQRPSVLLPEVYPDTLKLASGETRNRVDLRMPASLAYCVEGSFDTPGAAQIFVSFSERLSLDSGWSMTPATIPASADGKFRTCGLHTGTYRITVTSKAPGASLRERLAAEASTVATGEAVITNRDLRDLRLAAASPAMVSGDASFDPPPREKPPKLQIILKRSVNGGEVYADSPSSPTNLGAFGSLSVGGSGTDVPGPFTLGRHFPGEWDLTISRLPARCYVKEAAYGAQDLTRSPLRIGESGAAGRVRLVLGCDAGSLTARVTDTDSSPVPGAVLYLFAANADSPGALAATLHRADVAGGWSAPLTALRPGKYLALATDLDLSPRTAAADEIEELWNARGKAKEVEIDPGAVVQLSLTWRRASFR